MSYINYVTHEINIKIVYYGPGLCGKTTNVQYVYERTNPDAKGKMISLATEKERTLFFDFLPLSLGDIRGFRTRLHLYSVPGQVFYDASRKLLLKNVDGIVFVADSQWERVEANAESLENLRANLAEQGYSYQSMPLVMQYNKRDLPNAVSVAEMATALNTLKAPEFEANARSGVGVFDTLKAISRLVLNELKNSDASVRHSASTQPPAMRSETIAPTIELRTESPPAVAAALTTTQLEASAAPAEISEPMPPAAATESTTAPTPVVASTETLSPAPREPFKDLSVTDISRALAQALNSESERIPNAPFPLFWIRFPRAFPLGLASCLFAFPPPEFSGRIVLDKLALDDRIASNPWLVFSTNRRQREELLRLMPELEQNAAVVSPTELKAINNDEDSPAAFSRFLSRQMPVGPISPYPLTSGVNNDMLFFGRRHLLDRVLSRRGTNYALFGGRRLGKTALLQAIQRRGLGQGMTTLYVSLTGDDLIEQLGVKLGLPGSPEIEAVIRELRTGPYRLILIDEADEFIRNEGGRNFAILKKLHSLSADQRCNFIFAGFWHLFHACKRDYSSPMFNFAETLRVGPLEGPATLDLLSKPMANLDVDYDPAELVQELAEVTGGRANLLTRACRDLLYHLDRRRTITRDDTAAVLASSDFRNELEAWKTLSGYPTTLSIARANHLDRVVVLATVEKGEFTQAELLAALVETGVSATREELEDSLSRLELDYILARRFDRFVYCVPMFRKFLREQEPGMALEQELRGFEDTFALNA